MNGSDYPPAEPVRYLSIPGWGGHILGTLEQDPIVFIHGFMGRGLDWQEIATRLTRDHGCLLVDLPGHGQSGDLPGEALSYPLLAAGLVGSLERLRIDRSILVGYSLGGRLALYTALTHPDRFRALVLESASPGITDPAAREQRAANDDDWAENLIAAGMGPFLASWYRLPLFASLAEDPHLLQALIAERETNDPLRMARVLRELSPGRQPALWDRLGDLHIPVLLIAGERDEKYSRLLAAVSTSIPDARLEIIASAGHHVHLEQPKAFLGCLVSFIAGLPKTNPGSFRAPSG